MRATVPMIISLACAAAFADLKVGYELQSAFPGVSHGIQAELAWPYVDMGLKFAYGAKGFYETEIGTRAGGRFELGSRREAQAFTIELPVHLKYGRWPYLVGRYAYERILSVDGVVSSGVAGFPKSNDFSLAYGLGYEYAFTSFGLYFEGVVRDLISETDKTRYYQSPAPAAGSTYRFHTHRTLPGPEVAWTLGINHAFGASR